MPVKIGSVSKFSIFSVLKEDGTFDDLCELWVKLNSGQLILVWRKEGLSKFSPLTELVLQINQGIIPARDIEFVLANKFPLGGNKRFVVARSPLELLIRGDKDGQPDVQLALENKFPSIGGPDVPIEVLTELNLLVNIPGSPGSPDIQFYLENQFPQRPRPVAKIKERTELFIEVDVRQKPGIELAVSNVFPQDIRPPVDLLVKTELFVEVNVEQRPGIEFAFSNEFPVEDDDETNKKINVVSLAVIEVNSQDYPRGDIEFAVSNNSKVKDIGIKKFEKPTGFLNTITSHS